MMDVRVQVLRRRTRATFLGTAATIMDVYRRVSMVTSKASGEAARSRVQKFVVIFVVVLCPQVDPFKHLQP